MEKAIIIPEFDGTKSAWDNTKVSKTSAKRTKNISPSFEYYSMPQMPYFTNNSEI